MKFFHFVILLIFLSCYLNSDQIKITHIRTIQETDENLFYGVLDLTVSEDKFIYLMNYKENYVSKFGWNGSFIKKTGQQGKGPGDFNSPGDIDYYKGNLYINDLMNSRIVVMDKDLNLIKIIKSDLNVLPRYNLHVTGKLNFIGTVIPFMKGKDINFIRMINGKGELVSSYFNQIPYWNKMKELSVESFIVLQGNSNLRMALNSKRDKIVFTQTTPLNPAKFYFYTTKGKFLRSWSYPLDKKYRFPKPILRNPGNNECFTNFNSIHFLGDNILTQYFISSVRNGKRITTYNILIFNQSGKILAEQIFTDDKGGLIFHITEDYFIVSMTMVDDEVAFNISKIEFLF